ncbi:hypothetical protein [Escherichia coli]|uniref:hypothetical protein n=1 Tax=Escherichia coli TaxID=562 RepID=UPI00388DDB05
MINPNSDHKVPEERLQPLDEYSWPPSPARLRQRRRPMPSSMSQVENHPAGCGGAGSGAGALITKPASYCRASRSSTADGSWTTDGASAAATSPT